MDELDQLDGIAAAADANADTAAAHDEAAQALPPGPDYPRQAAAALDLFCGMIAGYAPETAQVFTPDCKQRIAMAAVPVMEKYGFTFDSLPPEIVLLAVAGPPMYQAARMVATRMEADKRKAQAAPQAEAVQAPEQQPGQVEPVGTTQDGGIVDGITKAAAMPAHTAPAPERHPQEALYR